MVESSCRLLGELVATPRLLSRKKFENATRYHGQYSSAYRDSTSLQLSAFVSWKYKFVCIFENKIPVSIFSDSVSVLVKLSIHAVY